MTLDSLLRESVLCHVEHPALVWAGERLSYRDLDEAVNATAVRLGDVRDRRVALIAPNTPALVIGLLAIWRSGATAVPLNARLREHELRQILSDAQPASLVSVESHGGYSFRELAARLVPDLPSLFVDPSGRAVAQNGLRVETTQAPPAAESESAAAILYTSGTSGEPKGAIVSHSRELDGARHLGEILELRPEDAVPFVIPLSHAFGLSCLLACMRAGATAVLVDSTASLRPLLDAVAGSRATVLHGSPRLFSSLLDAAPEGLPGIRTGFVAGSASPPDLLERLDAVGMRILNLYGLTELGAVSACRSADSAVVRYSTAGRPLPGHELRLVDGELQVLSPYASEWFRTGDLAELEDGYLRITGRISELVNVGGFNVSPAEVEAVLLGHASVAAAAVVGVGDVETGETLHAFVVARPGAEIDRADLLRFARARIAGYKLPYAIHVVSELPLLPSGKPDRQALRAA